MKINHYEGKTENETERKIDTQSALPEILTALFVGVFIGLFLGYGWRFMQGEEKLDQCYISLNECKSKIDSSRENVYKLAKRFHGFRASYFSEREQAEVFINKEGKPCRVFGKCGQ